MPGVWFLLQRRVVCRLELQRSDDAARLRALGLRLAAKGGKQCFRQPCPGFDGRLCRLYAERPERCRTFACRLLQRVIAGELAPAAALRSVTAAARVAGRVRDRVRALGETDETLPLRRRYARIMAQPRDFAGDESVLEQRSKLMLTVDRLAKRLARDFLT